MNPPRLVKFVVQQNIFEQKEGLGFPFLVVKAQPLCSANATNIVVKGVPDSDLVLFVPGQGFSLVQPGIPSIVWCGPRLTACKSVHRPPGIQPGCLGLCDTQRFTL